MHAGTIDAMSRPLEDYALIGDSRTAALVGRDGSIDWLCVPRFDSPACFAALVGDEDNGAWALAPRDEVVATRRAYRDDSMVLDAVFEVRGGGRVRISDAMVPGSDAPRVVRLVTCEAGRVAMRSQLKLRFDYGQVVPWAHRVDGVLVAVGGPDAVVLYADVPMHGKDFATVAEFALDEGDTVAFQLAWFPSYEGVPAALDVTTALAAADTFWHAWAARCRYDGPWRSTVLRSLLTLKALTDVRTGAVVAAPTASIPEQIGGVRNWDYRYCWLRDATFVLVALANAGYDEEALAWRSWLLRAVAGNPSRLQILYGLRGERRVPELTAPWLHGYEGSQPVRIGNAAAAQLQLDVYGEVVDVMLQAERRGLPPDMDQWSITKAVVEAVEERWNQPDRGLWEVRGETRHFVHSKVLAWVALDRAIVAVEQIRLDGPLDRWRALRERMHADICLNGFDPQRETFTQSYGSRELDAATLLIPLVGFLPATDERVRGTVCALSNASSSSMGSCTAIRSRRRPPTGFRPVKVRSSRAAFGSPTTTCCKGVTTTRAPSSSA
jgi:GH15 family glucan-1,4-alpha-glucosidase